MVVARAQVLNPASLWYALSKHIRDTGAHLYGMHIRYSMHAVGSLRCLYVHFSWVLARLELDS